MARDISLRTCLAFVLFSCVVLALTLIFIYIPHIRYCCILHIRLYHSLPVLSLSKTCRTHKRCPVSLSGPERLYSPVPPRPACSRPPDLGLSPRMNSKSPTMCSKEKQEYHVPSTAQVRTYSRDFLQSSKSRPLRPQSPVSHTNQRR